RNPSQTPLNITLSSIISNSYIIISLLGDRLTYKVFCDQCNKNVLVICGNCEAPLLKEKKCSTCGSFKIACSICENELQK
ncbi:MAG: hypothetical protein KAJ51_00630, partial [Thermoplasmata archaeon]|nr:hypothetical protein [Thermoplasmata archaeon]